MPENDFWVTEETTFADLCEDATRYFLRKAGSELAFHRESLADHDGRAETDSEDEGDDDDHGRARHPIGALGKLNGTLVNAHLMEWEPHDRVLARLNACPSEQMRQVVLKVGRLRPWERLPKPDGESKTIDAILRPLASSGDGLSPRSNTRGYPGSPMSCSKEVSTLQDSSRAIWRRSPSAKTPLRESIHHTLRGIFAAFSLRSYRAEEGAISLQSFLQFIAECRIPVPRERATLIYVGVRCKTYDGFLSMLLRLARVTHGNSCRSEIAALEALLNEHVAPHTVRWDTWKTAGCPSEALFLRIEQSPRLLALLDVVRPALRHAFDAYCVRNPKMRAGKGKKHDRFLTLGQFQLAAQDFDLFAAGTFLDARISARIYVTCCEHHGTTGEEEASADASSKMCWDAFLQAVVRLAIVLAIPLDTASRPASGATSPSSATSSRSRDRHFAQVVVKHPELPLKGLLQHLHFNIFARPAKLRALCQRLENRHWRRGPVTPLGTQMDMIACSQKLARVFGPLWSADGGPADYFALFADEVLESARRERDPRRQLPSDTVHDNEPAAGGHFAGVEDPASLADSQLHVSMPSPSVSTVPSFLATGSRASSVPPAASDPAKAAARYIEDACQQAEDALLEAAQRFTRRADACAEVTQGLCDELTHEASQSMRTCVKLYELATLRFRAALRSIDQRQHESQVVNTKWRWAVSILGFALRLQASCQAGLGAQQTRTPFAGGWGFCSWEALLHPSTKPALRGPQFVRAYADFIEMCEFARACVENAERLLGEVQQWHNRAPPSFATPKSVAPGKSGSSTAFLKGKENLVAETRSRLESSEDGVEDEEEDEDQAREAAIKRKGLLEASAQEAAAYQLSLDRASGFRLLGSLRMLSLRFQLMSPENRYAGGAPWDSVRFFRAIARSVLAADHYFGRSALAYEKVRFSKHFRVSLLNNWAFVLFERAQVKALAMAALDRATQLEGCAQDDSGAGVLSAARLARPIRETLARSRQLTGLGFELALPTHANREWLLPVALLWTWTNCVDLAGVSSVTLGALVAHAATPCRNDTSPRKARQQQPHDARRAFAFEKHVFALEASEVSTVLVDRARMALISLFDSAKTQVAELQDPRALPEEAARGLVRRIFAWDKNEYYVHLVSSAMKAHQMHKLSLTAFLSFMVHLALEDPIGFAKTLYQGDLLHQFDLEDARPTRKVPTSLFIASLLYPSFAESARARRHRRSYIRRLSTPSPLMFQDDHTLIHAGGSLLEQSEYVEAPAAVPENSLVDHFVVLDAHQFAAPEELSKLSSLGEARLAPRVRTVWPPTVEGVLEEQDDHARGRFTLGQLAAFRALHEQAPLPNDLLGFCFRKEKYTLMNVRPGASAHKNDPQQISVTSLVLTDGMGTRRYAVVLTFWEEMDPHEALRKYNEDGAVDHLLATAGSRKWYAPTSLCILSRWPMYQTFERFLRQVLRLSRMDTPLPLERYIASFISETPVPPPGGMQVQTVLYDLALYIRQPALSELPLPEVSMTSLFANLSVGSIITLFACLMTEQKVALCCTDETKLTQVAEAMRALLFPLDLQSVYIPVLPPSLMEFLYAPVPYFMGINSACVEFPSLILPAKSMQQANVDPAVGAGAGLAAAGSASAADSVPTEIRVSPSNSTANGFGGIAGNGGTARFSSRPTLRPRSNSFSTLLLNESSEINLGDAATVSAAIEPQDVVFVDLDRNVVVLPLQNDNTPLALPQLPKASGRKLRETLTKLARHMPACPPAFATSFGEPLVDEEARRVNARTSQDSFASRLPKQAQAQAHDRWCQEVRQAFLGFHLRLLRNYKRCIVRKPQEIDWTFDRAAFLADHASSREFVTQFLGTQLFAGFLQDAIAAQNGQTHARQRDLDLFDALLTDAENRAKATRLYTRQKKKVPTPLLDGASAAISKTHFVPLGGKLDVDGSRARGLGAAGPRTAPRRFPDLDPMRLGARTEHLSALVDVPRIQVPFAKVEISELKRVASRQNLRAR